VIISCYAEGYATSLSKYAMGYSSHEILFGLFYSIVRMQITTMNVRMNGE
jgi:hypothetical protein